MTHPISEAGDSDAAKRHQAVLSALATLHADGAKVTLRGLADMVGLKATSSVHHRLQRLVAVGHASATAINGNPTRRRYAITDAGRAVLSATN